MCAFFTYLFCMFPYIHHVHLGLCFLLDAPCASLRGCFALILTCSFVGVLFVWLFCLSASTWAFLVHTLPRVCLSSQSGKCPHGRMCCMWCVFLHVVCVVGCSHFLTEEFIFSISCEYASVLCWVSLPVHVALAS